MEKIKLVEGLEFSRIIHGQMRILDWNMSTQELLKFTEQIMELGIDTFDNADIYGNYTCEDLVGKALALKPGLREKMTIVTKCGINILSNKFPQKKIQYYDYRSEYIIQEAENSLKNLRTDYIDVLLLHRPSDILNPEEVANAFGKLRKEGKVRYFGVSNFLSHDVSMLQSYLDEKLVTNQIEISPYRIIHFENGNMNYCLEKRIKPMAYCPMADGRLVVPTDEKSERIVKVLNEIAEELNVDGIDKVIYSWLFMHPSQIMPINGSGKINHIKRTVEAMNVKMSIEQWSRIYVASRGIPLP
jgi:predicted oxidoreductase